MLLRNDIQQDSGKIQLRGRPKNDEHPEYKPKTARLYLVQKGEIRAAHLKDAKIPKSK